MPEGFVGSVNPVPIVKTSGRTLDHVAYVYDWLSPLCTFGREKAYHRQAINLLSLSGGESVLDIGCGTGTLARDIALCLSGKDIRVTGIDAAPKMVEVAKKKNKGVKNIYFDLAAAEQLPYSDSSFDCAISSFFFHHINFALKKKALSEMYRVLKPHGRAVIIDVDTPTNLFGRVAAYLGYWLFRQEEIKENIDGRLRQALAESDFRSWREASKHCGYIAIFKLLK